MKNFLQRRPQLRTNLTTQTLLSMILLLLRMLHQGTPATEISWILCSFNHGYRAYNNI